MPINETIHLSYGARGSRLTVNRHGRDGVSIVDHSPTWPNGVQAAVLISDLIPSVVDFLTKERQEAAVDHLRSYIDYDSEDTKYLTSDGHAVLVGISLILGPNVANRIYDEVMGL